MKKTSFALVAFGALTGSALAQSSTSIFGVVDLAGRIVKNRDGKSTKSLFDGGLSASRIGLRGDADLGGGLKAGFWLEAPVFADTGGAGHAQGAAALNGATIGAKFFQRRATVSLINSRWGEVRLGRDFAPSFLNLGEFDAYATTGFAGNANLVGGGSLQAAGLLGSGAGTIARVDNSAAYYLPEGLGGVYGSVMAGASEGVNNSNGYNGYLGARVGWSGGPARFGLAAARTRIPGNGNFDVWNLGGSCNAGFMTGMAFLHHAHYTPAGLHERAQTVWGIGASIPFMAGEFRATYQQSDMHGGNIPTMRSQDDARQYALGYVYHLSRQAAIYGDVGRIADSGLAAFAFPGGVTTGLGFGAVPDRQSNAADLGLAFSF